MKKSFAVFFGVLFCIIGHAQELRIITWAGDGINGSTGDNGPATHARMSFPSGVCIDLEGNIYIADPEAGRIRKVDTRGIITTIAGSIDTGFSGDGGPATTAKLGSTVSVTIDKNKNIYISDQQNNRIRKVSSAGIITTFAGTGGAGGAGDGGPATAATFTTLYGIQYDSAGNSLFVVDGGQRVIRRVDITTGVITRAVGSGALGYWGDGGPATAAAMKMPVDCAIANGQLYFSDYEWNVIRVVDLSTGIIKRFAGSHNCKAGYSGDGGLATFSEFRQPYGLCVGDGNLFVSDWGNGSIRMIDSAGTITTYAGCGIQGYSGDDGAATGSNVAMAPYGIGYSGQSLYIADTRSHRLRKVYTQLVSEIKTMPAFKVQLYPSPFGNRFTIECEGGTNIRMEIYDAVGKLIKSEILLNSNLHEIDANLLHPGVYLLELKDHETVVYRSVIQKI
jgi:Secretion system C-terminal sorting domain